MMKLFSWLFGSGVQAPVSVTVPADSKTLVLDPVSMAFNQDEFCRRGCRLADGHSAESHLREINLIEETKERIVRFESGFKLYEGRNDAMSGYEKLKRLERSGDILFGASVYRALWLEPERTTLEWLRNNDRIEDYLDFFGTRIDIPGYGQCILAFEFTEAGFWRRLIRPLAGQWYSNDKTMVMSQVRV